MTTSNAKLPIFFLLILAVIPALRSTGQSGLFGSPEIISFSKSDYHAGTQNWSIVQDTQGVIFFGNNKGLLEFDGTTWQNHQLPNRTIVRSLYSHPDGTVFAGGQDELGYLSIDEHGKLVYSSLKEHIPEEFRGFEDVWKIFSVGDRIFFCTQKLIYIWEDGTFRVVKPQSRFENFFTIDGEIYAQDIESGLMQWKNGKFTPVRDGRLFAQDRIVDMLPHQDGILIITAFDGLFLKDESGIREWITASSTFLSENQTYSSIQLTDGNYAIGTTLNGLLVMDQDGEPQLHLNKATGLQNNTVLSILQDNQDNLWLSLDNGIDYVKISTPLSLFRSESGIEGTGYTSVVYDNKIYLGTNQGLFYRSLDGGKDVFQPDRFQLVKNTKGQVWSLNTIGGKLIAGMHDGAYRVEGDEAVMISDIQGAWKFLELKNAPGLALEGTYAGLALFENEGTGNNARWKFKKRLNGFSESARVLEQDEEGNLWVSHAYKGLFRIRLSPDNLSIQEVTYYDKEDGLPDNISTNVVKVKGEVVFTTPQGVYLYDKKSDRFLPHTTFNDLIGQMQNFQRLLEDETGNLWFSAGNEFGLLRIEEKGFLKEVKVDKLLFNHLQEALVDGFEDVYAYDGQNVIIATEKGFVHYNPMLDRRENMPFSCLIRQVISISRQDSMFFGENLHLMSMADAPRSFPYSLRSFRFVYSAPFYEHLNHIHYRYRLKGYDETWSEWTSQTEKEFTNLPHGDYAFEVEAKNAFGHISRSAVFHFNVEPPWYATGLAKALYLLLGVLLFIGLFRYYSKKLEKEKQELISEQNRTIEKKEAEFKEEKKQSEAEIIRLRNENLVADIKHKNAELASATMHLVQKGEILLKIKNELNKLSVDNPKGNQRTIRHLIHAIDDNIRMDNDWDQFEAHFDQVHENFLKNLREAYPNITPKDQKLCAYLRMNLTTKEIAPLMNISVRGVEISRYRLRKKLGLDSNVNLVDFIMKF